MSYQVLYELKCPKGFPEGFRTEQRDTLEEVKAFNVPVSACFKQIKNTETKGEIKRG